MSAPDQTNPTASAPRVAVFLCLRETAMAETAAKRMVTRAEYADRMGVSVRTIERWEMKGYGPAPVRFDRVIRYDGDQVEAFVSSLIRRAS